MKSNATSRRCAAVLCNDINLHEHTVNKDRCDEEDMLQI